MPQLPEFWKRISQILVLAAPFILALFGFDITGALGLIEALILGGASLIVIAKDLLILVRGWFSAKEKMGFSKYMNLPTVEFKKFELN